MTIDQLKSVKVRVDGEYLFKFKDGREINEKGSYILRQLTKGFKLDKKKIESLDSITPVWR